MEFLGSNTPSLLVLVHWGVGFDVEVEQSDNFMSTGTRVLGTTSSVRLHPGYQEPSGGGNYKKVVLSLCVQDLKEKPCVTDPNPGK